MIIALAGALLAAVCYGVASVLQAVGAAAVRSTSGLDLGLLRRLVGQRAYVAGLLADGVAFLASLVALRSLPLFLVQSAIAGSVGVTAVVASRALHVTLSGREKAALSALGLGLAVLALAAQEGPGRSLPLAGRWSVLAAAGLVAAAAWSAARMRGPARLPSLAALAGLAFSGTGIAARSVLLPSPWWHLATDPLPWALVLHGLLGVQLFAMALQSGSVTVASAVTFTVETVVPASVGLSFLGDAVRPGWSGAAVVGFSCAVGGAVLLSRFAGDRLASGPDLSRAVP